MSRSKRFTAPHVRPHSRRVLLMSEQLESRVLMSVTPSVVANRISGVAPLSVNFDATATTSTATTSPFHDIQYSWNFGDSGSGTWSPSGRSRNTAGGPVAGHVFEQPGTYTVTLNVRDPAGTVGSQTVTVTVQDPNTVFSGTNTIVFSTTGDFTAAPAGALQVTTSSVATIASYAAPGKRLLLHRGETWNNTAAVGINKLGPGIIGAYGTGAKPTITSTASDLFLLSGKFDNMDDWRFLDLNLTGAANFRAFAFNGEGNHILIDRVDMANFGTGLVGSVDILNYWNSNGGSAHALHDGNAVVNSTITHGLGGGGDNGMFISGQRLMLMGNSITDMPLVEHDLRVQWAQKAVINDNFISTPASAKHNLKLHAPGFSTAGVGFNKYTEQLVVANNTFEGAANPWTVAIGPENAQSDERVRDLIFENNFLKSGSGTQIGLVLWTQQVTARNNIFNVDSGDTALNLSRRGVEPAPDNNRIFNNTARMTSGSGTAIFVASAATNTTVKNNLLGGAGTALSGGGTGLVQSNNLQTSTPGFVSASPTVPADFQLTSSSPAVDTGTATPLWNDFGGNDRPAGNAFDIGAWEFAGTPAASEVILDNASAGVTITGTWPASTFWPGYYGANYIHDDNAGKGTKSVRYTPTLTISSYYEVFTNFTAASNRDAAVPFDINYAGGTRTVLMNQQINNGVWVSLGTYAFNAGTSGNVLIRNAGTTGYVVADAIKFVPVTVAPIIQDNTDATGITITGAWPASTFWPGYYGANYIHDDNAGKGTKSVRYTPTLLASGNYEVFTLATAASNRATNIPFDINFAGGTSMVFVNQQINNGVWVSLGTYAFTAGTSGSVLIRTDGTTGYVAADAIKFVPV